MSKKTFSGEYDVDGLRVGLRVPVYLWKEENLVYAMSPALDITGYGYTEEEAQKSFEVMMEEFVSYTHRKKTIYKVLEGLGWTTNKKKKRVAAPLMEDLLRDNEELRNILKRPGVKQYDQELALAL